MKLSDSISKTISYSQIFQFPLSLVEVHHWLITDRRVGLSHISPKVVPILSPKQLQQKKLRLQTSVLKFQLAASLTYFLRFFPFIWFVGVTGSVAANNAADTDDLDIFFITAPSTLWLVRPFVLLALNFKGVRRNRLTPKSKTKNLICPNLWLDYSNLRLSSNRQSLYTAHEILQTKPILNKFNCYEEFLRQNSWTKKYLANAYPVSVTQRKIRHSGLDPESIKNKHLFYYLLTPLNIFFFLFQFLIMFPHRKGEEVGLGRAFFHDKNFEKIVSQKMTRVSL